LSKYERKPAYASIIETINMVLSPILGGNKWEIIITHTEH
jgi:hypothetical protein